MSSIAEKKHKLEPMGDTPDGFYVMCTVCKQEFEFPEEANAESCEPEPVVQA